MTPFGEAIRKLRERKGVSQKQMAAALNVSPAYLSALEHGKRGLPSFDLLQRIAGYFNIIWDEAEELFLLARSSDPRVVVDTSGLSAEHTAYSVSKSPPWARLQKPLISAEMPLRAPLPRETRTAKP